MNAPTTKTSPLTKLAAFLSIGSLIWTTWSLFDLLGAGPAGITVAVCADAVWGSVIYAEYRGVRLAGRSWPVALFGWAALITVATFLVWHGIADNNLAMAYAGPFLPLGAKVVWALALADMRDPAALTDDELHTLAAMERGMVFDEKKHEIQMRQQRMGAELLMNEVSTDFDIELMRQDKGRELQRRRPLELSPAVRPDANTVEANVRPLDSEPFAQVASDSPLITDANGTANDANTAGQTPQTGTVFGFSAALPETNANSRHNANGSPRNANTNTPRTVDANDANKANGSEREQAEADYHRSVRAGTPLSGAELGRRYGRTPRWGQKVIAELKTA
ncbi:MAG: DMT family transporter [Streptomyces sp.]|nr:DMT family transporter [Streptomyces sp.]